MGFETELELKFSGLRFGSLLNRKEELLDEGLVDFLLKKSARLLCRPELFTFRDILL